MRSRLGAEGNSPWRRLTAYLRALAARHEPPVDFGSNFKAGLGAVVGMALVGKLAALTGLPLLLAPLGATAVLLFGQPSSPLAQPVNIMIGYLIGTICCELAMRTMPGDWLSAAVAVGATIFIMRAMCVTHPPAGAMPILSFGGQVQGSELFAVVLVGCVVLITLALVIHHIPPRRQYPLRPNRDTAVAQSRAVEDR